MLDKKMLPRRQGKTQRIVSLYVVVQRAKELLALDDPMIRNCFHYVHAMCSRLSQMMITSVLE